MKRYIKPINEVIEVQPAFVLMGSKDGVKTNIGLGWDSEAKSGSYAW